MCSTFPGEVSEGGGGVKMLPGNARNLPQDNQGPPGQVSRLRALLLPFSHRAALFMHPQCPHPSRGAINAALHISSHPL